MGPVLATCTCVCPCVLFVEFGSKAFNEFLELLGQKVKMRGFAKYRAQLDNKSECSPHTMTLLLCAMPHHEPQCMGHCAGWNIEGWKGHFRNVEIHVKYYIQYLSIIMPSHICQICNSYRGALVD